MTFDVGDRVLFGRPRGEKTLGEIVGQTRTGKLKIRQLEQRGRGGRHGEGQVWTVPASLVQPAVELEMVEDEGFELPELHLAFAYHHAQLVVQADGRVVEEEARLLEEAFPFDDIIAARFFDPSTKQFTPRFGEALRMAIEVLPEALSGEGKFVLMGLLLKLCLVDGDYHPREAAVLLRAGLMLGVSERDYWTWVSDNVESVRVVLREQLAEATADLDAWAESGGLVIYQAKQPALYSAAHGIDIAERERLLSVLSNPTGRLTVVASRAEVEAGDMRGWDALIQFLLSEELMIESAGRLIVSFEGFEEDSRRIFEIEACRQWLLDLQHQYPWLATWLDPEMGGGGVLACCYASPDEQRKLLNACVNVGCFGAAFALNLGSMEFDHVRGFMGSTGIPGLPDDFFEGLEEQQALLDENGRRASPG
jgi:uncharacterized tellurite resistance protein B-like protein